MMYIYLTNHLHVHVLDHTLDSCHVLGMYLIIHLIHVHVHVHVRTSLIIYLHVHVLDVHEHDPITFT